VYLIITEFQDIFKTDVLDKHIMRGLEDGVLRVIRLSDVTEIICDDVEEPVPNWETEGDS
jgi:hypothetical protein